MIFFELTRCGGIFKRRTNSHCDDEMTSNFQLMQQSQLVEEQDVGNSGLQKKMPFMTTWGPVGFVKKLHPLSIMVTLTV